MAQELNLHPELKKAINALFAATVALVGGLALVCIIDWVEWKSAAPGEYETTLVTEILGTFFLVSIFLVLTAIITIILYIRFNKKPTNVVDVMSPLYEVGVVHEKEINEMLKSIARPEPGTNKLNRANTVHFIRALNKLELIDPNISNKHLMLWIEQVTGYEEKSLSAFGQALKLQKDNPELVAEYRKRLEQIIVD